MPDTDAFLTWLFLPCHFSLAVRRRRPHASPPVFMALCLAVIGALVLASTFGERR